jgi:ABC-type glycerol-3-phosphate transport system substrate-binding protein
MKITLFQGIVYGVFVVFALIGVIVFATYSGKSDSVDAIGVVSIWGTLPKNSIDATFTFARQSNQALKSVSYTQVESSTFEKALISAIAEGRGPDLILIPHESLFPLLKLINPIPVATLSESVFKNAFAAGTEIFLVPDGSGAYAVPFLIDPLVLYENRRILASNGVATPPATWEALTGLVPVITTKTATGNIARALIALGTYTNVTNARAILATLFMQSGVPLSTFLPNGLRRADLGVSEGNGNPIGPAVLRFYTQFADSTKVSYTWNPSLPQAAESFLAGDLALYLGFASEVAYFTQANPNLDFETAFAPQLGTRDTKVVYGTMYGFAIPRGSANPSGAYQAAIALTDPATDQVAAAATHMAPAGRALLATRPSDPASAVAYTSALYARGWLSPSVANTNSIFSTMITNVTSGRLTIKSGLTYAESALTALLQQ